MCRFNEFLWRELAKLLSAVSRMSRTRWCVVLVFLWHLSDGILYIQRTIVKNLTKTMEIIIDFFFIWK